MSWSSSKNKDIRSTNPDMASLLKDLDKLEAADNNSPEPAPTTIVAEDIDSNGSLVNVYWSVDEVIRDKDAR